MQVEIWKFIVIMAVATALGMIVGYPLESLLIAALGFSVWQIYQSNLLYQWVRNPRSSSMMESSGLNFQIHRELHRQNHKSSLRKKQMKLLLKQFRKAIGALPDAIVLIDEYGKIEWANRNAKQILGIRWPEDSQVRLEDLIRYPEVTKLLELSEPNTQGVEVSSLLSKGSTINIKCVPYTSSLRMVVARDVSRLLKVNQMHSDFVANVSHELKTPLTVLRGYLEIIADRHEIPEKFQKPIAQMNVQSARMQFIVNDLLYLARLEDNDNVGQHDPIDVKLLINTVVEAAQPLIDEKNHTLELDIDYSLKVIGAQAELHSAFSNLINNAIHYTPKMGLIRVSWQSDGAGTVFSVSDNGLGIAQQHLDRLTQRFYRVDADRSRAGGGTGLGLAIVKHVLQRHDGSLQIKSEEGVGSTFSCLFQTSRPVSSSASS
jgi:two-component system phosphate regulon sensor histidine kinase PhoR